MLVKFPYLILFEQLGSDILVWKVKEKPDSFRIKQTRFRENILFIIFMKNIHLW